jgi:phosphoadenosine phosphosulfate reductase
LSTPAITFRRPTRSSTSCTERLELDLQVYRSPVSPAWQEARFGRRWEQGIEGLDAYNRDNKVEPMERALRELDAGTWLAGLRRSQAETRRADAVPELVRRALESPPDCGLERSRRATST